MVAICAALVAAVLFLSSRDDVSTQIATPADAGERGDTADADVVAETPQRARVDVDDPPDAPPAPPAPTLAAKSEPPFGKGRIDGIVTDRHGRPVPSFELAYLANAPDPDDEKNWSAMLSAVHRQVDDAGGRFELDVEPGRTTMRVLAKRHRGGELSVDVRAGTVQSARIVLEESAALFGEVRDAQTRAPIEGAHISIPGGESPTSDRQGHFESDRLPEGRFGIHVNARGYRALLLGGLNGDRSRDQSVVVELDPLTDGGVSDQFIGTGFRMGARHGVTGPYVAKIFPGTPAAAVLQEGDDILEIDGTSVEGIKVFEARSLMFGDLGTLVRLGIRRNGQRMQVDIERARISADDDARPR